MLLRTPGRDIHIFLYFPLSIPLLRPAFGLWSLSQISLLGTVKGLLSYPTCKLTSEPDLVHDSQQQQQPEDPPTLQFHRPHREGEGCLHSQWVVVVPNLFGTRDWFHEDNFSTNGSGAEGLRKIQAHHIYRALYFYYYYISSTSDHQALDPRGWGPLITGEEPWA